MTAALLLVVGAALLVYAPALGNGFVWDDTLVLERQLSAFRTPLDAFLPPSGVPQMSPFYYRPLVVVTYLLDRTLGGGSPLAFHLTPVVLHATACALLLLLLRRLLGAQATVAATGAALAFAVHPAHAEVVAWMAGRSDALAAVGVLGALLAWTRWLEAPRPWTLVAGAVLLLAGLLGKETAAAAVPLALLLPWVPPPDGARRSGWPLWAAVGAAVGAYLALRTAGLGAGTPSPSPAAAGVRGLLGALGFYVEGLTWPRAAPVVRTTVPIDGLHVGLGALGLLVTVVALAVALRRSSRPAVFALAWIAAALAPALLLAFRAVSETPVAERYLYLPSAGVALLLALALARLAPTKSAAVVALGLVLVAPVTFGRSTVWHDNISFWRNAVAAVPDEGFPQMKLGVALYDAGDLAAAETAYRTALASRLSPAQRAITENNLGQLLLRERRHPEAEPLLRSAVEAHPRLPGPYVGLAECLWERSDGRTPAVLAETRGLLATALQVEPRSARAALLLGRVRLAEGAREDAARWFAQAARVAPRSPSGRKAAAALAALGGG
jgi:tetratricopeptide (TPR) repeat protein